MTKHDFIFSNQRRHRMARHAAFWGVWCLAYLVLFQYPVHSFKGWSLSKSSYTFKELGVAAFFLKTLIFNALLAVVVPQALFTYVLLYHLLPNYFFKKRAPLVTACMLITALLIYYLAAIHFRYLISIGNYLSGASKTLPPFLSELSGKIYAANRDLLTSFPIITGFALMIKLIKRWWLKQRETEQLVREKTKAELQLLKAQVHPHFMFNTLNNIYYFTLTASPKAPEMIKKLSGLLHYILNECNQPLVPLSKEMAMIRDYTALEKVRYGEQMNMTIEIAENDTEKLIAPLLLIPFVENSFKHGASKMLANPWVKLRMAVENGMLHFSIENSRPQENETLVKKGSIGLSNVKKRLELLYPAAHELNIVSKPESFAVYLKIQLQEAAIAPAVDEEQTSTAAYAMA
ncbi:MAG: histidine kinase [Bacteroidota bacterium]|nr:histidine kinase [Bacteroidota bacterium]